MLAVIGLVVIDLEVIKHMHTGFYYWAYFCKYLFSNWLEVVDTTTMDILNPDKMGMTAGPITEDIYLIVVMVVMKLEVIDITAKDIRNTGILGLLLGLLLEILIW